MFMNKQTTLKNRIEAIQITKSFLFLAVAALVAFSFTSPAHAEAKEDYLGNYATQDWDSIVNLYKCGDKLCGRIVWLKEPNYPAGDKMAGKPKVDRNNPEASKQNRKIMGMNLVWGFTWDGEKWSGGKIYNPKDGKTYSCWMKLNGKKLTVRGYVGISALGKTVIWHKRDK